MLKWVFGADTGPFRKSLNGMRADTKKFSADIKGQIAGMFGGAAVLAGVSKIISSFARIKDIADRFGESAESIQRVGAVAVQAGLDLEGVARGMTKATQNAVAAASGSEELAEAFQRLGINAAEFANLPIEQKLIALNEGYNNSASAAQGLSDIMKVMGKSGAEAIPLLTQAQGELQAQMEATRVAGEKTVQMLATMDDQIEAAKQTASVWMAYIIAAVTSVTTTIALMFGALFDNVINGMNMMVNGVGSAMNVVLSTLAGDFEGAKRAASEYFQGVQGGLRNIVVDAQKAAGAIANTWRDNMGGGGAEGKAAGSDIANPDEAKDAEKAAEKAADKRKKLVEDIAKLEEDARIRSLSLTEKLLDAEKRRAELAAESLFSDDENKRLESQKAMLEIEKELEGLRKEQAGESKKLADEKQSLAEKNAQDLIALAEESAQLDRDNKFNSLDEAGQLDMLRKERDKAREDERAATKRGDSKGALEAGNRGKALTGQIDDMMRGIADQARGDLDSLKSTGPTIATSSLAQIGGGGGARMMENDYQKKIANLLEIIADNTAGGSEGSKPPAPI